MKPNFLFVAAMAASLAACGAQPNASAPTALSTPPVQTVQNSGVQTLGYAYDAMITAQTAYLAYLNTGTPNPATVRAIDPLYQAAKAALASYADAVQQGTANGTEPPALVNALAALQAGLAQYGLTKGT